jgi:uncharacterized membrane protein
MMSYLQLAYIQLATIFPAFVIGTFLMLNHKGTPVHKLLGKIYMSLMMFTASVTLFMSAEVGPKILNHFGFIHLLSFFVLYTVPSAYLAARNGHIKHHRNNMVGLYLGGILVAGAFTFMPGRLFHNLFIL